MVIDFASKTIPQPLDHRTIEQLSYDAHRRETRLAFAGARREHILPAFSWVN